MKRKIPSGHGDAVALPVHLVPPPRTVIFPLSPAINRCEMATAVHAGDAVSAGDILAQGPALVIHASVSGIVEQADAQEIVLRREEYPPAPAAAPAASPSKARLPEFARDMGLVGMGGSMFPASIKLQAAERIHTLVINAVECEPGIQIDEALILHEEDAVRAGFDCLTGVLGTRRAVLAVKRSSMSRAAAFAASCGMKMLEMPNVYPGGAEKLIVARLEGHMPPTGVLPVQLGYLVFSVASLWALGRRLLRGEPSILRPLTLVAPPHPSRNLIVPVGTPIRHILDACGVHLEPTTHLLVAILPGSPGEVMPLLSLFCGIALLLGGIADWRPGVMFIAGFAVACPLLEMPLDFHLAAGSILFTAVFIVSDPRSMPGSKSGRIVAGLLAGILNAIVRKHGFFPEGVVPAVLAVNLLSPTLDRIAFAARGASLRHRISRYQRQQLHNKTP